jgi:hypothetical protein
MKTQRCEVKECRAVVHVLPLEAGEVLVDPRPIEVVVRGEGDRYRIVSGYRPHWTTCVDIVPRSRRPASEPTSP